MCVNLKFFTLRRTLVSLLLASLASTGASAMAVSPIQQSAASTYECTQVSLDEIDPALLTKEERIALLDNSLSDSIDQFSSCVGAAQQSSGNGQGLGAGIGGEGTVGANGQGEGGQSDEGEGAGEQANEQDGQNNAQTGETNPSDNSEQSQPTEEAIPQAGQTANTSTSSTPSQRGIIPPKNNDKVICKLLYDEITKTTNADMIKGLKEQYTNYKCG